MRSHLPSPFGHYSVAARSLVCFGMIPADASLNDVPGWTPRTRPFVGTRGKAGPGSNRVKRDPESSMNREGERDSEPSTNGGSLQVWMGPPREQATPRVGFTARYNPRLDKPDMGFFGPHRLIRWPISDVDGFQMSQQNTIKQAPGNKQDARSNTEGSDRSSAVEQLKGMQQGQPYAVQAKMASFPGPYAIQSNSAIVQAKGDVSGGADAIHGHARAGIQGPGGSLPHSDTIQKSFGHHDVSGIVAHTGGAAAQATDAMGAQAYATGNHVAFNGAPSLHTAAHEAAHVIQQQGGVQLKGGVGAEGDRYEQHADAVADAVVAGKSAEGLLDQMAGGGGGRGVQMKTADPNKGITDGNVSLEDFNGGAVGATAKGKAGLAQSAENNMSLVEQAASINTQTARSEQDMLAAIAAGGTPRFVARVDAKENFESYGTFGNPSREFVFATEPADLRGCKPGEALIKVGWIKSWLAGKIGKDIAVCVLDTQKTISTPSGDAQMGVGKMEWPELIAKAMGDTNFKAAAQAKGVKDDSELQDIFAVLEQTPVKATPAYKDPQLALKVRKLLDTHYGANELYTGMGATMNTEGGLGSREVMVTNNGTGLKLTPQNHILESLGTLTQTEVDAMP